MMSWLVAGLTSWYQAALFWIRRYGLIKGIKVAVQFKRGARRKGPFEVNLPDFDAPIWLRGQTVDLVVFYQVIQAHEYGIPGSHADELRQRYEALVRSAQEVLIIDCGANIGLSSVWYAREFPSAKIVAVEPDPSNLEIASRNIAAYPNVKLVAGAVWDKPTKVNIVNPEAEPWKFRVQEGEGSTPCFTIDQLSEGNSILIVKIDIEGSEKELFRSNTDWMDRTSCIAIELHDWLFPKADTSQPFMRAIAKRPHEILLRGENLFFLMKPRHEEL
jgi:FkbM family methyltransferase